MKKILLVDDERIFHFLSAKIFEVSGVSCEIHSAYNGKEALDLISEGLRPDFVFVDLDMPIMNGFQFIEGLKKMDLPASKKIVVLSSHVMNEERDKALALGADVYMGKPLSETDVRNLIGS